MLKSTCETCCFCCEKDGQKACAVNQYCVPVDNHLVAPGVCRMYRHTRWAKKWKPEHTTAVLGFLAVSELQKSPTYDVVIPFDSRTSSIEQLERTWASCGDGPGRIIVIDGNPKPNATKDLVSLSLRLKGLAPFTVDHRINENHNISTMIIMGAQYVTSRFFLVIPPGLIVQWLDKLLLQAVSPRTRAIYYPIPTLINNTLVSRPYDGLGLYVTACYRRLGTMAEGKTCMDIVRESDNDGLISLTGPPGDTFFQ